MALVYDLQFTGTAGTVVNDGASDYAPDTGAKWQSPSTFRPTLNGSGQCDRDTVTSNQGFAYSPATAANDGTAKIRFRNGGVNNGPSVMLRGNSSLFGNGYLVRRNGFTSGVSLLTAGGTVLASSTTYTGMVDQFSDTTNYDVAHVAIVGTRIRVWMNGNTGTADIDYTDASNLYPSGLVGMFIDGASCLVDYVQWYDDVQIPAPPVYPKNDNQDPRRALRRVFRSFRPFRR